MATKTYVPRKRQKKVHGISEDNKFVVLPKYFEDVLWKDLHAELQKVGALVFVNIYNGEVNHVTVKKVNPGGEEPVKKDKKAGEVSGNGSKETPPSPETIPPPEAEAPEEEIPEEGETELPPEEPEILPTKKETTNAKAQESKKEKVQKEETGQTLEEGHRVLARYNGQEVRGEVKRIIEDGSDTEVILLLENGKKAVVGAADLISIIVSAKART